MYVCMYVSVCVCLYNSTLTHSSSDYAIGALIRSVDRIDTLLAVRMLRVHLV